MAKQLKRRVVATDERVCEKHGPYTSNREEAYPWPAKAPKEWQHFWTNCPGCDKIYEAEADYIHAEVLGGEASKKAARDLRIRRAGIPMRYQQSTLWNWEHGMPAQDAAWSHVREMARAWESHILGGRSVVFCGGPGAGKTHLAVGLLQHVLKHGGSGLYTTMMDYLQLLKNTFGEGHKGNLDETVAEFATADLVVVDEVGKQSDTNFESEQFFRLMNKRYVNMKPTVLISNMGKVDLFNFLGDSVVDRIREGGGRALTFNWDSYRSKKK